MSKLTFRGQLLSDNSGAVRLVILKNDFGRLGEVGQHDKNVLAVRGLFLLSRHLPLWRVSCLQDLLRRTHIYEVKYSALYFTWKLDRKYAKLLDKILRI